MRCGFFRWDRLSMVDRDGFGVRPFQIVLKTPFLLILITSMINFPSHASRIYLNRIWNSLRAKKKIMGRLGSFGVK